MYFLVLILLTGCLPAPNPWKLESISTGEHLYDSARLLYAENDSSLRFEFVRLGTEIEAFINLKKFRFSGNSDIKVEFSIAEERIEASLPFLEGKMRLKIPRETTERIIQALQEGNDVAIMVDGFEEHLYPERFNKQYDKLAGSKAMFRNPFKGLFDP